MTNAKNVYALMLALVIVLSGCFGNTTTETDAQDSESDDRDREDVDREDSGENTTHRLNPENLPPVISVFVDTGLVTFTEGDDCMSDGMSVRARHAMTDWDGTIVNAGWDVDLDGQIDYPVTDDEGYTILEMSIEDSIWNNVSGDEDGLYFYSNLQNSVVFGAQDDDGEWTSSSIFTVSKRVAQGYVNSSQTVYWDNTPCTANNGFTNIYTATDASAGASAADDDTLLRLTWQQANTNLHWVDVVFTIGVGNMTYYCSTSANQDCSIAQDGSDDSLWETNEFLTISENGVDIVDGTTEISIYITYGGNTLPGTNATVVA